jgi:stress response protein YsnF
MGDAATTRRNHPDEVSTASAPSGRARDEEELVVPVVREELAIGKEAHTERVVIEKQPRTRELAVDVSETREAVEVDRVPVGRYVDQAPGIRVEGDTTIIPVLEEVAVVEKRLLLKEEVRVTKRRSVEDRQEGVSLREEHVTVRREPAPAPRSR